MKTLQEIKDEYAREKGKVNWSDLFGYTTSYSLGNVTACKVIESHLDVVSLRFSKQVAKQALINASESFREEFIKKDNIHLAITSESNIPTL